MSAPASRTYESDDGTRMRIAEAYPQNTDLPYIVTEWAAEEGEQLFGNFGRVDGADRYFGSWADALAYAGRVNYPEEES